MKVCYQVKNLSPAAMEVVDRANAICAEYAAQGYTLTLRQLYYQFVSKALIPNRSQSYDRLGRIITDARVGGLLDWRYITDRGRELQGDFAGYAETPEELVLRAAEGYFEDLWDDQPRRIEVWIEKEALIDVAGRACRNMRVAHFACKGYVSVSEMREAGVRLQEHRDAGREPLILHLGDHDPSGIDMTRDIRERLEMFSRGPVEVKRIALNMDQVEQYNPPPNPAKVTDSRARDYIETYGTSSWELDALEPNVLVALIQGEIRAVMNDEAWSDAVAQEREERQKIVAVAERWTDIQQYMEEEA